MQLLFEEFLQRIDANYPMGESLARRYRTQRDLQLMERIEGHLTAESHDTDASVGAAIAGGTAAGKIRGPQHQQRKLMRRLWHDRDADIRQRGSTQPFSNAWGALRLDFKTVKRWIPQHIIDNWQTRKRFTWEEFTALWPEHLRADYAD